MRYVFDPTSGSDVTANVQAVLMSSSSAYMTDLFWLQYINPVDAAAGPAIKVSNMYMTNSPQPISVGKVQGQPGPSGVVTINANFQPSRIKRGPYTYEIGLGDQSCDVTWYTDDSQNFVAAVGHAPVFFGFKWALVQGYLDECPMNIYTAFFGPRPTPNSPAPLLGTTLMWRGFIREIKADRGQVVMTLASLMHVFQNVQVPTQTIQPGNRLTPYYTGRPILFGNSLTGITPLVTSTPTDLQFTLTTGYPVDHQLRDNYFTSHQQPPPNGWTPASGQPGPQLYRIRDNITNNTPVAGTLHVYPYEPINPVTLVCPLTGSPTYMEIFVPLSPSAGGSNGFPYVPPPEVSL